MKNCLIAFFVIMTLSAAAVVSAAESSTSKIDKILNQAKKNKAESVQTVEAEASAPLFRMLQEKNKMILLVCIIIMTPIFLYLVLTHIKNSNNYASDHVVHGSALVLVIQATTFIVVASPTSEQLTAAIGVLGAIAGYLFGSATRQKDTK